MQHVAAVARPLRVELFPVEVRAVSEIDSAFESIVTRAADGVLRLGDTLVSPPRKRAVELATK
jgi:hypothetical protein